MVLGLLAIKITDHKLLAKLHPVVWIRPLEKNWKKNDSNAMMRDRIPIASDAQLRAFFTQPFVFSFLDGRPFFGTFLLVSKFFKAI